MSTDIVIMGANGRMGSTLARLTQEDPELNLVGVIERPGSESGLERWGCETGTDTAELLPKVPGAVVIDFTAPEASVATARTAAKTGNPMVIGTTGLNPEQQKALADVAGELPVFWAPNMSVGVNVLLKVLPELVKLLGENYDMEVSEIHHKMKKDAPSGTAIKLAEILAEARGWDYDGVKKYCREGITGERPHEEIGVQTLRGGDVVGEHTIYFFGPSERIEVTHMAHSREMFAAGALRAAKWLGAQKPGKLYNMQDIF